MFNHQSNNLADVSYNYFGDNFDLVANTDYSEGEQIYISYGKQSNDRLLQYYGFVEARNPYDVYDFSVGIIELLLKYSEEINSRVPIPPSPEPEQRLRIILQALENTDIESEQSKFVRKGDKDISKEEYTTKYYRIAPKDRATSAIGSISSGSILEKFDDISVRCVRALYMDTEEWNMAFSENAENFNLNEMGKKLSKQTEEKVSKVMKEIIALELAGKPTTLEEDKRLLEELQSSDKSVKGFNSKIKKSGDDKNPGKAFSTDPSGIYRDRTISAVLFRIEKKTLLTEALS